jgi:hypothetical protein
VTPLVTYDTGDPLFSAFVCGEHFFAVWTLSVVTLDKDGLFEVIISLMMRVLMLVSCFLWADEE